MTSLLPTAASTGRPEPVLDAARIAGAVSGAVLAIGAALVLIGWATADQVKSWAVIAGGIVTAIGTLVAVAMPIITAYGARAQVTPLAAPVSVGGVPLIVSPLPAATPAVVGREITDALRELDHGSSAPPWSWPETRPVSAVGPWTPATPAVTANEPTPIAAEAEAATTGRIPPVVSPTI